jgi:hypothetical protein
MNEAVRPVSVLLSERKVDALLVEYFIVFLPECFRLTIRLCDCSLTGVETTDRFR